MPVALVQWAMHHDTAFPQDDSVNTFHFDSSDVGGDAAAIVNAIDDSLYDAGVVGGRISQFLSSRLTGTWTAKVFDLSDPEPRQPVYSEDGAFTSVGASALPEEVAVCLSYRAAVASGELARRRRGRIYIGPLSGDAANLSTGRPHSDIISVMALAAENFRLACIAAGFPWGVYSRVDDEINAIINGYVDNAWDTQRRRGVDATSRTEWPP